MDDRLNAYGVLGLAEGDAHVIRNPGGVVTEGAIRSLTISQRLLGTTEIILHHSDCGMLTFKDDEYKEQIRGEVGIRPPFALEAFPDVDEDVRHSIRRLQASPLITHKKWPRDRDARSEHAHPLSRDRALTPHDLGV